MKNHRQIHNLLFAAFLLPAIQMSPVSAQTLPTCSSAAADPDGDGYGWENKASCRVSSNIPVIFNKANGAQVALVRPYWNAARDIENRTIQCDRYYFSDQQARFVYSDNTLYETQLATTANGIQYFHHPLPPVAPSIAYAQPVTHTGKRFSFWTVDAGVYIGASMFGGDALEMIEINGVAAVRRWNDSANAAQYYDECYDSSGVAFQPTGYAGEPAPEYPPFTNELIVSDYARYELAGQDLSITNRETGAPVLLERAHWDVRNDLAGKVIGCTSYEWNEFRNEYYFNYSSSTDHYYYPSSRTSQSSFAVSSASTVRSRAPTTTQLLTVENRTLQGERQVMAPYVERVKDSFNRDAIRIWTDDDNYKLCTMSGEITRQGGSLRATRVGYGLSPSGTSPEVTTLPVCIDTDGDGWGWNGSTSCPATPTTPETPGTCIDSDGDGWGWDGQQSCRVGTALCVDTTPLNDGWGWNGVDSCRVGQ